MFRHIAQKRGVRRDRHGRMTVADAGATWDVYAALGRLYRRDPKMAKALFPGIHGFVAESVAQNRLGWDAAESDPAARTAVLKRIYLDADKKSFEAHKHGLYILPWIGPVLAAPEAFGAGAELVGHMRRGEWDRIDATDFAAVFAPLLGGGAGAVRAAQQWLRNKRAAQDAGRGPARKPDGSTAGIEWSRLKSTNHFFGEVARNTRWSREHAKNMNVPTFGAGSYKGGKGNFGAPIRYDDGRSSAWVGEVRLYREGGKSYAIKPDGTRVDIGRLPRNATRADDGGWEATMRAADGTEFTVYYNPHGLPEFPARGAFWLPPEVVKKDPRLRAAYVQARLRDMAHKDSDSLISMQFSLEQIEKIKQNVSLAELGLEIHHDYRVGRMLIVNRNLHRLAHIGGRSLW